MTENTDSTDSSEKGNRDAGRARNLTLEPDHPIAKSICRFAHRVRDIKECMAVRTEAVKAKRTDGPS